MRNISDNIFEKYFENWKFFYNYNLEYEAYFFIILDNLYLLLSTNGVFLEASIY